MIPTTLIQILPLLTNEQIEALATYNVEILYDLDMGLSKENRHLARAICAYLHYVNESSKIARNTITMPTPR
jgi:hypothetical protein